MAPLTWTRCSTFLLPLLLILPVTLPLQGEEAGGTMTSTPGLGTFQVSGTVSDKLVDDFPDFEGECPGIPTVELWIDFGTNTVPAFCLDREACLCKDVPVGAIVTVRGTLLGRRVNAGDPVNEDWIVVLELEDLEVLQTPTPKN